MKIEFTKPQNLNGTELLAELEKAGIIASEPLIDDNDSFWLDLDNKDVAKAKPIIAAHNGNMVAPQLTIAQKLAIVGLSIEDLKAALA
jgi:hypothetical protein